MRRGYPIKYYTFVLYDGEWHRVPFWEKDRIKALRRARDAARKYLTENATCGWKIHVGSGETIAGGIWTGQASSLQNDGSRQGSSLDPDDRRAKA